MLRLHRLGLAGLLVTAGVLVTGVTHRPAYAGNAAKRAIGPKHGASLPFGLRLANAALARRWVPVIYNPAYVRIAYPGGDVPWYTGVCTDVIIRSYRSLGIDLQVKVHRARVGSGDTNIDHRRVNILRRFFARKGKSLPISKDATRYKPGDIVTMHLPEGRSSKTHIAIVTQHKSSTGVPLIVHNRGFGVQLEDWLFARKITGHFRYQN